MRGLPEDLYPRAPGGDQSSRPAVVGDFPKWDVVLKAECEDLSAKCVVVHLEKVAQQRTLMRRLVSSACLTTTLSGDLRMPWLAWLASSRSDPAMPLRMTTSARLKRLRTSWLALRIRTAHDFERCSGPKSPNGWIDLIGPDLPQPRGRATCDANTIHGVGVNLAVLLYPSEHLATLDPAEVVRALHPRTPYAHVERGTLPQLGFPDRRDVCVGSLEHGLLVATRDAALFNPTKLARRYLKLSSTVVLVTQQSVYDMFAFARWSDGALVRSISVNPVGKVWESIGEPEQFENPFWDGERPAEADYPLPFHPLEMAEAAHAAVLGAYIEGTPATGLLNAERIVLDRFARSN